MVFFNFLNFFYFFLIFYYASGRNGTDRKFLFYLIHILFQPIFARNVAIFLVFYILNFLAIFLKFYITHWVGTKRNDNFYFFSFSSISNLLWLEMKPQWYFLIFRIFFLFLWNILLRDGKERNGTIIFILSHSHPFPTYFCQKCCHIFSFLYFEFFGYFFEILNYALGRNETER